MSVTRRDFLRGASVLAGAAAFAPIVGRVGEGWASAGVIDPAAKNRRRLVLIDLCGGNDGLNTVVPMTGQLRKDYEAVRAATEIDAGLLRHLGPAPYAAGGDVGLHPSLKTLHSLYQGDRVAVVQGVYYGVKQDLSHFTSADIWQSGDATSTAQSGWLGRHLDRTGIGPGELRALAVGSGLPLSITGADQRGSQLLSLPPAFPDGQTAVTNAVHQAYGGFSGHPDTNALRAHYGDQCAAALDLVESTKALGVPQPPSTGWPAVVNGMLAARELLTADLGVEIVTVKHAGFDTHANQVATHARLLTELDQALEAFFFGTVGDQPLHRGGTAYGALDPEIAQRTVVMTFSEFGRRIGDNSSGTDHGAAAPLFLVGPPPGSPGPALGAGIHGAHPALSDGVTAADNLAMTTDFRAVYQSVVGTWLSQPEDGDRQDEGDPAFPAALSGLFV